MLNAFDGKKKPGRQRPVACFDFCFEVSVPHVSNIDYFRDPTHKTPFTYGTFDYFVEGLKPIEYSKVRFKYLERKMVFSKGLKPQIGRLLFNLNPKRYEKYYCWKYPCYELHIKLQAIKA